MESKKITPYRLILVLILYSLTSINVFAQGLSTYDVGDNIPDTPVMHVVEIKFNSNIGYTNPYLEVDVWIDLKNTTGLQEEYRIPVFWDGGNLFKARLVATSPGAWEWEISDGTGPTGNGAETTNNIGYSNPVFSGANGTFTAIEAADPVVSNNDNNRGFIRVADNNRTLEYANNDPFFYTADTSWAILTDVFDYSTSNGVSGISFTQYINDRKGHKFNGMNVISSFPSEKFAGIWGGTAGLKSSNGAWPFVLINSETDVDYLRINPAYWDGVDVRMQYLADQGFVTLFETVRRSERWHNGTASEKSAFYNYVRYLWARYGCYNMIFSWVHLDSGPGNGVYIGYRSLIEEAHGKLSDQLGNRMPYGQPRTAMSFNTSRTNWSNPNEIYNANSNQYPGLSNIMDIENVSNAQRDEDMHRWLKELYFDQNIGPRPALNLEPFYPGWGSHSQNEINLGLDATTMAQMQMYGSVLSGGLAGHAWGDGWHAGEGYSAIPSVNDTGQINALTSYESQAMGHLQEFMLDSGHEYHKLIPAAHTHLSFSSADPSENGVTTKTFVHTLSIAVDTNNDVEFALGFFTADDRSNPNPLPIIEGLKENTVYRFEWWDVTNGVWNPPNFPAVDLATDGSGEFVQQPDVPDRTKSWAYRIRTLEYINNGASTEEVVWLEAECGEVGSDWQEVSDATASEGAYLIPPSTNNTSTPPTNPPASSVLSYSFNASAGTYEMYGLTRFPSFTEDSFWVRVNGGAWIKWNVFSDYSNNFTWRKLHDQPGSVVQVTLDLLEGANTLEIVNREAGTAIDKIHFTTGTTVPTGLGDASSNCNQNIAVTGVSVSPSPLALDVGQNGQLTAAISPSDATDQGVSWTSSDTGVATINSSSGQVTAIAEGAATITATTDDGGFTDSATVNVTNNPPSNDVVWLEAECGEVGSDWQEVSDTTASEGAYLIPPSTNNTGIPPSSPPTSSVLSYSFNALAGTYVMYGLTRFPSSTEDSFWVRANGGTWMKWNVFNDYSNNFTWRRLHDQPGSGGVQQVTLDLLEGANTLEIVNREAGTAIDKIYFAIDTTAPTGLGGASSNCNQNIAVTGVSVSPSPLALDVGENGQLTAAISPSDATNQGVSWTSSDTGVATVNSSSGQVTAIAEGVATITATTNDGGFTDSAIVNVSANPPAGGDLVGHWPLDEQTGTIASDVSGQGPNGTLVNGLTFNTDKTSGQIRGALQFDGLDDQINLTDIDGDLQSGFSVSAWVKPSNAAGSYQGVAGSTTAGGFMMFVHQGKLGFKVSTIENGQKLVSAGNIQSNVWQMITCTFDGSDMRWYIDGVIYHTEPHSGTLVDKSTGKIGYSGWGNEYFEGSIDEVRIYDHPLTVGEIGDLFITDPTSLSGYWPLDEQTGTITSDVSGQGPNGTLENGITFDTDKTNGQIGGALQFDGLDDQINLTDIDGDLQSGFSVSAWVKPSNAGGSYQGVAGSTTAGGFMMFVHQGKLGFKVTTDENGSKLVSQGGIQSNVWQMITCTFDGSTMKWYIDDQNIHSESHSGTLTDKSTGWIGWSGWSQEYFEGAIDDVRLYHSTLTEQQVIFLFQEGDSGSPSLTAKLGQVESIQGEYVHPNPTTGRFRISGISAGAKEIMVSDFSSRVLITMKTDTKEPELDLSAYPDGIYIVKVLQNGSEQTFKVVKR